MDVVIVESPAKAKTINKYLGSNYQVLASYGHVRDLPAKDGSVQPDDDFAMSWEVDAKSKKRLSEIAQAVKNADRLILATDPDREGEAISWHVLNVLQSKKVIKDKPVQRVVFNAITKQSILEAMQAPRDIDANLVDAYLARRALDYLVGFTLSPVLWRKLPGARSAGRVQSVALRLVCDREREIEAFKPQEYWSILASLTTAKEVPFTARLAAFEGKRIQRLDVKDATQANNIKSMLDGATFKVASVEAKPQKRNPQPPFTTSTLQQEASRKHGFAAERTMRIAQRLYEGIDIGGETVGLITYMRTDGVQIAGEAIAAVRDVIASEFGANYVPEKPRFYASKAKNAQEAHEAIRPTDLRRLPKTLRARLDEEQAKIYELIWKRTMASQMLPAELERTTADIEAVNGPQTALVRASGTVVKFDGFLTLYVEGKDDEEDDEGARLPAMAAGEPVNREKIDANQHFTEPPPRYTEATLIKKMEELGIGRPSTYTATLSTLQTRDYVTVDKKRLIPGDKGLLVTAFLQNFFERYVEYDFTADLETQLDQISNGDLDWRDVLRAFWEQFSAAVDGTKDLRVAEVLDALNDFLGDHVFPAREDGTNPRKCPTCSDGQLSLKVGKFGAFVGCSNYPDCRFTRQLGQDMAEATATAEGDNVLGVDPQSGLEVALKSGRFGPYVQLGEAQDGEKPKRASLPKGWSADNLDLARALKLLSLPRLVGAHPETGKEITAGLGRYGPFVLHDGLYANVDSVEDVFEIGLNRAVTVLAEKAAKGGRGRATPAALKELGEHPDAGGPITVRDGRYGPYVNHGKVNATLPKGTDPQSITLEQAVELITAKAGAPKKKATTKKAATKKAAPKKTSKTKTATKNRATAETDAPTGAGADNAAEASAPWD